MPEWEVKRSKTYNNMDKEIKENKKADVMNPVRILQILGRLDRGGAETMIMNLYRNIDREQVQFDFVIHTTEECDYSEEVRCLGGHIYSLPAFSVKTALSYSRAWRGFLREHPEYKLIHSHVRSTASILLREAKKQNRITIVHSHNTSSGSGISAIVKNILQLPLRYIADYLFACSVSSGHWLYGEKACEGKRFQVLNNGIDTEQFRFDDLLRQKMRTQMEVGDEIVIGHIGRMEEQKNHKRLLEIVAVLKNVKVWLIGSGPLETEIKQQIKDLKLEDRVCCLGVRSDVPMLMQAMDVILFPSLFEGLPVTLIEAQASGLPILMSNTITSEVVVTDLVETCSLEAENCVWKEQLEEIVSKTQTPEWMKQRPEYCRKVAQAGYDIKSTTAWLQKFYLETVHGI